MVCIYCGYKTSVVNSRAQKRLNHTWRRRHCKSCGTVFTTIEAPDLSASIRVRTSTGTLVPYNRDRLFVDVLAALGHRTSPVDDATALSAEITAQMMKHRPGAIVDSQTIASVCAEVLGRFDAAAGTYFIAYHR